MTKKVPQKVWGKNSLRKNATKVPKIFLGGGGVRPSLENTQIKAAFFLASLQRKRNAQYQQKLNYKLLLITNIPYYLFCSGPVPSSGPVLGGKVF